MTDVFTSLELSTFIIAIAAGILIGIPAGPARFFVVDTSLEKGKPAALKVYGGFFVAALLYAGVALLADDFISRHKRVEKIAYFLASLLLIFWGIFIIVRSKKEKTKSVQSVGSSFFLKGFTVGISNPVTPFIYLALIQVLKIYSNYVAFGAKVVFLGVYEITGFFTTWIVALIVIGKKSSLKGNWRSVKIIMGVLLTGIGAFNSYEQIDLHNGIRLKEHKSFIETEAKQIKENENRQ